MRHVEESTGSIALNSHVFGACEASERDESAGLCDLCLVVIYTWMATRGVRLSIKNSQGVYTYHALQDLLHSRQRCIGPLRLD
jgi:hypothetical protein